MGKLSAYASVLRPLNGIMSAIAVYIGIILAGGYVVPTKIDLLAMAIVFIISGGGMVINDIFDAATDRINRPKRPIPSGMVSIKGAYAYAALLFAAGNAVAYLYLNTNAFYLTIIASVLLIAYNSVLKKVMLVGHVVVSFLVALTFIYGGVVQADTFTIILPFAALAFLANMGREIYKTIEDALGDSNTGITTISIRYGVFKARLLASGFVAAGVILSFVPYVWGLADAVYLGIVIIADIAFVAAIAAPMKHSSKIVKIGMNIALLAFLLGAYSMQGLF